MTDGRSRYPDDTVIAAEACRNDGIKLVAVGIDVTVYYYLFVENFFKTKINYQLFHSKIDVKLTTTMCLLYKVSQVHVVISYHEAVPILFACFASPHHCKTSRFHKFQRFFLFV